MGKNKKKFIDKKNASTYHLLHRSQRDVAGDAQELGEDVQDVTSSSMVLWPDPNNNVELDRKVLMGASSGGGNNGDGGDHSVMSEWRKKLTQAGLIETYDENSNDRYLKPITGTGTFYDARGKIGNALTDARSMSVQEEALMEVPRQFDSIPLTNDCMDDEIAQALFSDDFDQQGFEELNDDFIFDAVKEPENVKQEEAFDFDAHIAKLMEKAKLESSSSVCDGLHSHEKQPHTWGKQDEEFFSKARPLHVINDDIDDYVEYDESILGGTGGDLVSLTPSGVVPALAPDEERALCEKIEETLAEYDSDEIGDCLQEEICGTRPLEGDAIVENAIDEFCQERKDDIFIKGTSSAAAAKASRGDGGFSALVGTRMVPVRDIDQHEEKEEKRPVQEIFKDAQATLMRPELEPPPEEIQIDGKSYFSHKERSPWDCESILTTYSNLDNNPIVIGSSNAGRHKKKSVPRTTEEETYEQIKLSRKTGLPLISAANNSNPEEYPDDGCDETFMSVNRGEARKKGETKEEKKARKAAVKKERQMTRMQKKMTKEVYKEEFQKLSSGCTSVDVAAGSSVFRFS